jgi:transcriptional regulator with XRE-family HTH domain
MSSVISSREIIGKMISLRRDEKKITPQQLADLLGVDRQYVWRLENGKINLTMNYLDEVIKHLGCEHADFIIVSTIP